MKVRKTYILEIFWILCTYFVHQISAQGPIRLSGSDQPFQGRLEIWYNGQWGTVCNHYGWGMEEASVVCRQLGSPSSKALYTDTAANSAGIQGGWGQPIWLSNVQCNGQEEALGNCQYQLGVANDCNNANDVVVVCSLPGYIGCYGNVPGSWIQHYSLQEGLTVASCLAACRNRELNREYLIGALQGQNCWCGNDGSIGAEELATDSCNSPCPGDDQQYCGGSNGATSFYATNLGGAIGNFDLFNPSSGSIASPLFPGQYPTSVQWNLNFPYLVTVHIRMPYFDLNNADSLQFRDGVSDFPLEDLNGEYGASTYFAIGPVRELDILLTKANDVNGAGDALGFILFYEVVQADAPTNLPTSPTTRRPPQPSTRPTPTRPPPPPPPTTPPRVPPTVRPPPPTAAPPPQRTTKASTTTRPPTTRPRPTTATTTQRPPLTPPRTTKATPTTKKPTTTRRPSTPRQTARSGTARTTIKQTTGVSAEDDSRRRFVIDWWFEVWTFICVGVFVVGLVLIVLICWKSGNWQWLKGPRRRHHVIHRRYSSRSSWSDFYNFEPKVEEGVGIEHKHRHHSKSSSNSSHWHHRRHRRHDSHSSWSSTWTPSNPSHRSFPSSVSHSSSAHGFHKNDSTQYLIDPNHSYPGVIYHEGYPGQGPVAYPISIPQDDPIVPEVEVFDPCPYDGPPIPPQQEEIFDPQDLADIFDPPDPPPCLDDDDDATEPIPLAPLLDSQPSRHTSRRSLYSISSPHTSSHGSVHHRSSGSRSDIIPDPPAAPPPPPLGSPHIPEATPMHVVEDECGPNVAPPPPPPPPPPPTDQGYIIVPEVEPYIVAEDTDKDKRKKKKKIKKSKKSKHKDKSETSSNSSREPGKRLGGFGVGKSQKTTEEQPMEPVHVIEDACGPMDFSDRPTDAPQPILVTTPMAESPHEDLIVPGVETYIIPEIEPYIMAESGHRGRSTYESNKSGKRSKIFGIGKSKKKNKKKSKHVEPSHDTAIGDAEIEAVISGLDQSIQQAEIDHTHSITGMSDIPYPVGQEDLDNYVGSSVTGFAGYHKQHVRIPSQVSGMDASGLDLGPGLGGAPGPGIPDTILDVDEVFVVVQSTDGNRVDYIAKAEENPPRDFILPGEGTDDLLDDLDMFTGGRTDNATPRPTSLNVPTSLDMFNDGATGNHVPPPPPPL